MPNDLAFVPYPVYVNSRRLMRFVSRYEMFKRIIHVPGDIIVCGLYEGFDFFSFMKLHAEMEPRNRYRKLTGFDTFTGYTEFSNHDRDIPEVDGDLTEGGCHADLDEFKVSTIRESEVLGSQMPVTEIRIGDVADEGPAYVEENPDTIVSLLYLDMNLYEPTKAALECFLPLMSLGGIVALDNLCAVHIPGATVAAKEVLGQRRWQQFEWENNLAWTVI